MDILFEHHFGDNVRGDVRHGPRFDSLVLGDRTVQLFGSSDGYIHRRHCQLGGQLHRRSRISAHSGNVILIKIPPE